MLETAGLGVVGFAAVSSNGLTVVYIRASLAWLKDGSEDLSATMKALDQALEDAERWANSVENGSLSELFGDIGRRAVRGLCWLRWLWRLCQRWRICG